MNVIVPVSTDASVISSCAFSMKQIEIDDIFLVDCFSH